MGLLQPPSAGKGKDSRLGHDLWQCCAMCTFQTMKMLLSCETRSVYIMSLWLQAGVRAK